MDIDEDKDKEEKEGAFLSKPRTMPDMIGAFTVKSLVFAMLPLFITMVMKNNYYPLLLFFVTVPIAWLACLKDVYLFEIFFAAINVKPCRNKAMWGYKRYVPR